MSDNCLQVSNSQLSTLQNSIISFNEPLGNFIRDLGLPVDNILQPISEREKILSSLQSILTLLNKDEKEKSDYLTKFVITSTIGLFDASINYLWDETIKALRKLVVDFDIFYFSNVATSVNSRYKTVSCEEDLELIQDHDFLEICRRIGIINDVNFERLNHVNYLRNHISAAHPANDETNGYEIVSSLENCIRYAIKATPDSSSVCIKTLIFNIRTYDIPLADINVIINDLVKKLNKVELMIYWELFSGCIVMIDVQLQWKIIFRY